MTKCKECGNEISTKAEACPKCGAKVPKASVASGCLTIIFVLVGLSILGSQLDDNKKSGASSSSVGIVAQPVSREPAESVRLSDLLLQYKDNEIRGDALYKDRWIQTSGKVDDVKKDILGTIYVTVGTGRDFEIPQVQCFFDDSEAASVLRLTKGTAVTVQGRVDGLMMNVLVKDCQLVSR